MGITHSSGKVKSVDRGTSPVLPTHSTRKATKRSLLPPEILPPIDLPPEASEMVTSPNSFTLSPSDAPDQGTLTDEMPSPSTCTYPLSLESTRFVSPFSPCHRTHTSLEHAESSRPPVFVRSPSTHVLPRRTVSLPRQSLLPLADFRATSGRRNTEPLPSSPTDFGYAPFPQAHIPENIGVVSPSKPLIFHARNSRRVASQIQPL